MSITNLSILLGIISGIIAILTFLVQLNKWRVNKKWISRTIDNTEQESIIILAYLFLRADQIPETKLWGKTISKYINLNFPKDPYVNKRLDFYRKTGSITHTAHALKALYYTWKYFEYRPNYNFHSVELQLEKFRQQTNIFHPDHKAVVNIIESKNFAHELRHNSTALICIYFLKKLTSNEEIKNKFINWIIKSLDFVFEIKADKIWLADPQYGHSLAYSLQCFNYLSNDHDLPKEYRETLNEYTVTGIESMLERLENNFWLLRSHNNTKCFYTLLILEILLEIEAFWKKNSNLLIAFRIVENLARLRERNHGLSLGATKDGSKYSIGDIGTTARFAKVLNQLLKIKKLDNQYSEKLKIWLKESLNFIRAEFLSPLGGSYNLFTHSFESLLLITDLFEPLNRKSIKDQFIRIDRICNEWLDRNDSSLSKSDLFGIPELKFAKKVITRDMIHQPSALLTKLRYGSYWG